MSLCPCAAKMKMHTSTSTNMPGLGGSKSFAGSATGATEGGPYLQLLAKGPMDQYLIGPGGANRHSQIMAEYLNAAGAELEKYNLHKLRVYNNYY